MAKRGLMINFTATDAFCDVDYELKLAIRRAIEATLEYEAFQFDAQVSVTFCTNEYIRALNKKFRGVDKHTDVLSFPMYEDGDFDVSD